MSISSEITRIQNAKNSLKTSINAKTDAQHQITNETLEDYGDFVDSISTGIDTSDATAIATDIKSGKTAYVDGVKVTGTLSEVINPATISSTEIYNGSFFKPDDAVVGINNYGSYLVTDNRGSHIGTEYLVNWVKVTDLQTWFIKNQQKVKVGMPVNTIASVGGLSPNIIKNGVTVLGVTGTYGSSTDYTLPNGIKFAQSTISSFPNDIDTSGVTDMSNMFSNCKNLETIPLLDTSSVIDMSNMFTKCTKLTTIPALNTSNVTNMTQMFTNCSSLTTVPALNTSNVTNMFQMFAGCTNLTTVPVLDMSSVTNINYIFNGCSSLSNTSLNNILASCVSATAYTGTKTLYVMGIKNSSYYPASRIQALSNYQDFIDAGWTIGY